VPEQHPVFVDLSMQPKVTGYVGATVALGATDALGATVGKGSASAMIEKMIY